MAKKQKYQSDYKEDLALLNKAKIETQKLADKIRDRESDLVEMDVALYSVDNAVNVLSCCVSLLAEKDNIAEEEFMLSEVQDKMEDKE